MVRPLAAGHGRPEHASRVHGGAGLRAGGHDVERYLLHSGQPEEPELTWVATTTVPVAEPTSPSAPASVR